MKYLAYQHSKNKEFRIPSREQLVKVIRDGSDQIDNCLVLDINAFPFLAILNFQKFYLKIQLSS